METHDPGNRVRQRLKETTSSHLRACNEFEPVIKISETESQEENMFPFICYKIHYCLCKICFSSWKVLNIFLFEEKKIRMTSVNLIKKQQNEVYSCILLGKLKYCVHSLEAFKKYRYSSFTDEKA